MNSSTESLPKHRLEQAASSGLAGLSENDIAANLIQVRVQAARAVLWHYGDPNLGLEPGGFFTALLQAFDRADKRNFTRLAGAFPLHASLVREVKYGDIEVVRRIVKAVI